MSWIKELLEQKQAMAANLRVREERNRTSILEKRAGLNVQEN